MNLYFIRRDLAYLGRDLLRLAADLLELACPARVRRTPAYRQATAAEDALVHAEEHHEVWGGLRGDEGGLTDLTAPSSVAVAEEDSPAGERDDAHSSPPAGQPSPDGSWPAPGWPVGSPYEHRL